MAEIRINATGGLKLYDADDSHYAQILAGTISSNVDALTLGSSSATFGIPVTVGEDDTGHDVKLFGASAGAYMEWDESADELRIMGASADATTSTGKLLLATSLTDINANDVIGKIEFQAPHEAGGTDAITVAASIQALAQGTFSSSVNATDLIFYTGHSEAATEKFRFTSQGELGVGGANYGSDGQVLTSTGAGTAPAWEAAAGGGKIGQVIQVTKLDSTSTTSTSYGAISGITVDITPAANDSKILVQFNGTFGMNSNYSGFARLKQLISGGSAVYPFIGSTDLTADSRATIGWGGSNFDARNYQECTFTFLDDPQTTSEITYSVEWYVESGGTTYLNRSGQDINQPYHAAIPSSITVMEVLA